MKSKHKKKQKPIRPTRPQLHLDQGQRLRRKMSRPDVVEYDKAREQFIEIMEFRHNAEVGGWIVGIILHWIIVKPAQLIIAFMGVCAFLLMRPIMTLTVITVGLFMYVFGWFGYLAIITYWN